MDGRALAGGRLNREGTTHPLNTVTQARQSQVTLSREGAEVSRYSESPAVVGHEKLYCAIDEAHGDVNMVGASMAKAVVDSLLSYAVEHELSRRRQPYTHHLWLNVERDWHARSCPLLRHERIKCSVQAEVVQSGRAHCGAHSSQLIYYGLGERDVVRPRLAVLPIGRELALELDQRLQGLVVNIGG